MLPFARFPTWRSFFERDFEQRVVYIKKSLSGSRLNLLPGKEELFEILSAESFRSHDVLVLKDGTGCDLEVYRSREDPQRIDIANLRHLHNVEDCTVYLRSVQLYSHRVRTWVERLNSYLDPIQIHINAFLTPVNATGLVRHVDAHDTIMVQREGEKHWDIWLNSIPMNDAGAAKRESKHMDQNPPADQKKVSLWLSEGDVLYVPRGAPHNVRAGAKLHSLHYNIWLRSPLHTDERFKQGGPHAREPYPDDVF